MAKHLQRRNIILENMKIVSSTIATSSTSTTKTIVQPQINLLVHRTKEIVNEIIWTIHMTLKDSPDTEIECDTKVLMRMAPNDLNHFSMSRKKLSYTKKSIGDWFWETVVLEDIKDCSYSLMFDDTTNVQHKKELQLVLKYWSTRLQGVNFVHLKTAFLTSGKAIPAVQEIKAAITSNNLPMANLIQLGSDGPNVTKSIKTKINDWLKEEGLTDLFDLGSCHDHNLHNALKAGCEEMKNVHVLCQQVSEHFKSSTNWEEFKAKTGAELKFITFFSVRWTTLGPATDRIIKQWNQLTTFFAQHKKPENKQSKTEKKICELLQSDTMSAEILFISYAASLIEPVLTFLERQDQIIFKADDLYTDMLEKLIAIVMMPGQDAYTKIIKDRLVTVEYSREIKVNLSDKIQENIPSNELRTFHKRVFMFTKILVNYLSRKNFFHPFLYDVKFMSHDYIFKEGSIVKILAVVDYFKQSNKTFDKTKLFEELTILVSPRYQEQYEGINDIDKFYVAVEEKGKSPELVKLFRLVSALTISNAEVERHFSRSKLVITKQMSNLQEENFNARKHIISGMRFFQNDIANFPVTNSLISKVHHAHRDFKRKRDDDHAEQENMEKKQRLDEEISDHIRATKEANKIFESQMKTKVEKAGKLQLDLMNEKKALNSFLNCMSTCVDEKRMKELVKESQLSNATISNLEEEHNLIQNDILKMQKEQINKLTQKS